MGALDHCIKWGRRCRCICMPLSLCVMLPVGWMEVGWMYVNNVAEDIYVHTGDVSCTVTLTSGQDILL